MNIFKRIHSFFSKKEKRGIVLEQGDKPQKQQVKKEYKTYNSTIKIGAKND